MKYVDIKEGEREEDVQFWEILYNENLARGKFCFSERLIRETGGINQELKAKQAYELLLRAADGRTLRIEEWHGEKESEKTINHNCLVVEDVSNEDAWEDIRTDCYIVGRYRDKLISRGCFYDVVESLLQEAIERGFKERGGSLLEEMLRREDFYYEIAGDTEPILIVKGDKACFNIFNVFAEQFADALKKRFQKVECFDCVSEDIFAVSRMMGRHFKAIVGFESALFCTKRQDGSYLLDGIYGPRYNFMFDNPIRVYNYFIEAEKTVNHLVLDQSYAKFIQLYYDMQAQLFPPAGIKISTTEKETVHRLNSSQSFVDGEKERSYDISFVGTFGDYLQEADLIHQVDRRYRFLANRMLLIMRKNPCVYAEDAIKKAMEEYGLKYTDREFVEIFYQLECVTECVSAYYRQKVIRILLESGLQIDVFGNDWMHSPLCKYPNLVCHPAISADKAPYVYQRSKCSLNVTSWHKGGFTERMAGIMLNGAVLVTDRTTYLEDGFDTKKDMIVFDLDKIEQLPERIYDCLNNPRMRDEMAGRGQKKVMEEHTWDRRAEQFLDEVLKFKMI